LAGGFFGRYPLDKSLGGLFLATRFVIHVTARGDETLSEIFRGL